VALATRIEAAFFAQSAPILGASTEEKIMRSLKQSELTAVSGGTNPHLIDVNPGGQSNPSTRKNPNTRTVKTTGKWN
jgi:hypothetical protein